jgi:hypothetical protein
LRLIEAMSAFERGNIVAGVVLIERQPRRARCEARRDASGSRQRSEAESPLTFSHRADLVALALKHRLPGAFGFKEYVDAGGLMSYGADFNDLHRRAAVYIDKILKGIKPADLPVEQASKYQLIINLKTAKALGLELPATLIARADEVIE